MTILQKFNLSYSAWSTFKESELQFFFQYIKRIEKTNEVKGVYGNAGNVVHEAIEDYVNLDKCTFYEKWDKYNIDKQRGFYNKKLDIHSYKKMYNKACSIVRDLIDRFGKENIVTEEKFSKEIYGINMKGFYDLIIRKNGEIYICDWKTNSTGTKKLHEDQRLFYSWYIWKTLGIIPICEWYYLKLDKSIKERIAKPKIKEFDEKIKTFLENIQEKGEDISKYNPGNYKNPFNQYLVACVKELEKRQDDRNATVRLEIKGHFVFLKCSSDDYKLKLGIDQFTKFDLKDKYYMQERAKERGGIVDLKDIGTYHLYNKNYDCFPIGLLPKVISLINEYFEHYNIKGSLEIEDFRNTAILNQRLDLFSFENLVNAPKLRDYQIDAIKKVIEKKYGILHMATGSGKTFTAGEIIRQLDAKTLWIIDRKELLVQTKESLEKQLGIEIGVISGKTVDIKDITIATIQSLKSKLSDLIDYLYTVNFVIVDEFHKAAAESYQKVFAKLPNNKYRLGLTATPTRDDGKEPILRSILGEVIYKITAKELIEQGYLMRPEIKFIEYTKFDRGTFKTYSEEYDNYIINNGLRHNKIIDIIDESIDKKILILTKSIEHGKELNEIIKDSVHIHGSTHKRTRTIKYNEFVKSNKGVLILTHSIGAEGLDIPDLDIIINAAANKGDVKSIQILGRVLRKSKDKKKAIYYDFIDHSKNTYKHSLARMKVFKKEGHNVEIVTNI